MIPIVIPTDWFFLPAVAAFLQSLEDNSNLPKDQKILFIEYEPLTNADRQKLGRFEFDIGFLDIRTFGDYSAIMPNPFYSGITFKSVMYWRAMLRTLLVFKLNLDKILYLDADILCLGDITEIEDFPHFSVAPDWGLEGPQEVYGGPMFNTGVMIMEPSLDDFGGMVEHYRKEFRHLSQIGGDQPLINSYFYAYKPEVINFLPQQWNILKHLPNSNKELFDECWKDPKFVHYVSQKPWAYTDDRPCPEKHKFLNDLWVEYFEKAQKTIRERCQNSTIKQV